MAKRRNSMKWRDFVPTEYFIKPVEDKHLEQQGKNLDFI